MTPAFRDPSLSQSSEQVAMTAQEMKISVRNTLVIVVAAGLVLALLGPFGTYQSMSLVERLIFWPGVIAAGTFVQAPLLWAGAWLQDQFGVHPLMWVPASAVIGAVPITFIVSGVGAVLFGAGATDGFVMLYPYVLVITGALQAVGWLGLLRQAQRRTSAAATLPIEPAGRPGPPSALRTQEDMVAQAGPAGAPDVSVSRGPAVPAFWTKVPGRLGRKLVCLKMEDHYLRVHTAAGDALFHGRMADAEQDLAGLVEGMRVHRTWWVARDAITGWTRDGKTVTLTLSNGLQVPVARDRQPLLKAAGWLA